MNDFTGRVKRDEWHPPNGFRRTVTVAMDTAQYQMDINQMQLTKGEDLYGTFNMVMRRKPKVRGSTICTLWLIYLAKHFFVSARVHSLCVCVLLMGLAFLVLPAALPLAPLRPRLDCPHSHLPLTCLTLSLLSAQINPGSCSSIGMSAQAITCSLHLA